MLGTVTVVLATGI